MERFYSSCIRVWLQMEWNRVAPEVEYSTQMRNGSAPLKPLNRVAPLFNVLFVSPSEFLPRSNLA
jgi:hypothetical protein